MIGIELQLAERCVMSPVKDYKIIHLWQNNWVEHDWCINDLFEKACKEVFSGIHLICWGFFVWWCKVVFVCLLFFSFWLVGVLVCFVLGEFFAVCDFFFLFLKFFFWSLRLLSKNNEDLFSLIQVMFWLCRLGKWQLTAGWMPVWFSLTCSGQKKLTWQWPTVQTISS